MSKLFNEVNIEKEVLGEVFELPEKNEKEIFDLNVKAYRLVEKTLISYQKGEIGIKEAMFCIQETYSNLLK